MDGSGRVMKFNPLGGGVGARVDACLVTEMIGNLSVIELVLDARVGGC